MNAIIESIPIFAKITEGVKDHILMGDIKEGEQITSSTQLSREYNINIATVNKAINILVAEGIVFKKRGIGMFVSEGAVEKLIAERRKVFEESHVIELLREAKRLRYTEQDLQQIVSSIYNEHKEELEKIGNQTK